MEVDVPRVKTTSDQSHPPLPLLPLLPAPHSFRWTIISSGNKSNGGPPATSAHGDFHLIGKIVFDVQQG